MLGRAARLGQVGPGGGPSRAPYKFTCPTGWCAGVRWSQAVGEEVGRTEEACLDHAHRKEVTWSGPPRGLLTELQVLPLNLYAAGYSGVNQRWQVLWEAPLQRADPLPSFSAVCFLPSDPGSVSTVLCCVF